MIWYMIRWVFKRVLGLAMIITSPYESIGNKSKNQNTTHLFPFELGSIY